MGLTLLLLLAQLPSAEQVSADPDAALAEMGWRSSVRAKIGATPDFVDVGDDVRFSLLLPSFIELLNPPGLDSIVPTGYWRARIQLEAALRFRLQEGVFAGVAVRFEHESDHGTAPGTIFGNTNYGWIQLNAVALIGRFALRRHTYALSLTGTVRLHALTCTWDPASCAYEGATTGDQSVEGSLGASFQNVAWHNNAMLVDFFASAFGSYLAPTPRIIGERRITLRLGAGLTRSPGRLYVYVESWYGTLGGFLRNQGDVQQVGLGLGWGSASDWE